MAMFFEADLEGEEFVALVAVGVGNDEAFDGEFLGILSMGEGGLGDGHPGVLIEGGFGVEAFEVTDAAVHEDPDDAMGFGGEVWGAVGGGRGGRGDEVGGGVAVEDGTEGEAGEAHAEIGEESATGARVRGMSHRRVTKSL